MIGAALLIDGVRWTVRGVRLGPRDEIQDTRLVYFGYAFRFSIVGLSAVVAALGFAFGNHALAWLFIVIGVQELYPSRGDRQPSSIL